MRGILNVYKEKGYTSHDVVAKLRGICGMKKIGHTGTLDPDAAGVLPVCLGSATKVCSLLTDRDKTYEAVLLLGVRTDTLDTTGEVIEQIDQDAVRALVTEEDVRRTAGQFTGVIDQIPPMYSARKVGGRKLCDLARAGIEVEREARKVTIHAIELLSVDLPRVRMRVRCSKGTYIRTLCDDIGTALGCGGCMESLLRLESAGFKLEDAHTLSEIEQMRQAGRLEEWLIPVDAVFSDLPGCQTLSGADKVLLNGGRLAASDLRSCGGEAPPGPREDTMTDRLSGDAGRNEPSGPREGDRIRVYASDGAFKAVYGYDAESKAYRPVKMFL